jgi:hypothetical protein
MRLVIVGYLSHLCVLVFLCWLSAGCAPVPGPQADGGTPPDGPACEAFRYYCEDQATSISRAGQLSGTECVLSPPGRATSSELTALADYRRTWGGPGMCTQAIDQSINRQVY